MEPDGEAVGDGVGLGLGESASLTAGSSVVDDGSLVAEAGSVEEELLALASSASDSSPERAWVIDSRAVAVLDAASGDGALVGSSGGDEDDDDADADGETDADADGVDDMLGDGDGDADAVGDAVADAVGDAVGDADDEADRDGDADTLGDGNARSTSLGEMAIHLAGIPSGVSDSAAAEGFAKRSDDAITEDAATTAAAPRHERNRMTLPLT